MQNPRTKSEVKSFEPWKDKCDIPEGRSCLVSVCNQTRVIITYSQNPMARLKK